MSPGLLKILKGFNHMKAASRNYSLAVNPLAKYDKHLVALFPNVVRDLTDSTICAEAVEIKKWFEKCLNYVVPDGSRRRGRVVVHGYHIMAKELNSEDVEKSYYLGWCIELLQGYLCVIDDIIDGAGWRRGRPSWHKVEEVGFARAIQDGFLLRSAINELLKIHFKDKPYYMDLNDMINFCTFQIELGGALDLQSAKARDYSEFTKKNYEIMNKYRTGYNSYCTVAAPMIMTGITSPKLHEETKRLLFKIARVLQAQDDCMDAFIDSDVSGKIGTDIQDRKCSWPAVAALERASPAQREVFVQNYGFYDDKKVAKILEIYDDLKIYDVFKKYQEEIYHEVNEELGRIDPGLPREIFDDVLKVMYNRSY